MLLVLYPFYLSVKPYLICHSAYDLRLSVTLILPLSGGYPICIYPQRLISVCTPLLLGLLVRLHFAI